MTLSPKHLNLDEIWQFYKHTKSSLPETEKEYLVDEVIEILKKITKEDFLFALTLLYGSGFEKKKSPAEYGLLFIKGIKKNKPFLFADFIKSLQK